RRDGYEWRPRADGPEAPWRAGEMSLFGAAITAGEAVGSEYRAPKLPASTLSEDVTALRAVTARHWDDPAQRTCRTCRHYIQDEAAAACRINAHELPANGFPPII